MTEENATTQAEAPQSDLEVGKAVPPLQSSGKDDPLQPILPGTICPHCGRDTSQPAPVKPTESDKARFLAAQLTCQPFTKEYELFGGRLRVRFRTLTSAESTRVLEAVGELVRSGRTDAQDWIRDYLLYRMCLGVDEIRYGEEPPRRGPRLPEDATAAIVREAADQVLRELLPQETVRRVVGKAYTRFAALVDELEARADDPDFWKGTEPAASSSSSTSEDSSGPVPTT